jgi:ATP-dependent Clp protease ATP-binding subunit ClpC
MFEKFTERARKVMSLSRQESQARNGSFINTEHALIAILREGGGVAAKVLDRLGISLANLIPAINKIEPPSKDPTPLLGQLPFSPRMKRVLELGCEEASRAANDVVGTEHILLGLFLESDGIAAKVLGQFDVTEQRLRKEMHDVLGANADRIVQCPQVTSTRPLRITLYAVAEGEPKGDFLVVNNVLYRRLQTVTLDGVPIDKHLSMATSVAQNMGCQVYTVEMT